MKPLIKKIAPPLAFQLYHTIKMRKWKKKTVEETFTHIYENELWGKGEAGRFCSGSGTTDSNTYKYEKVLIEFIRQHNIHNVFEIGCGDFRIMQSVLENVHVRYIGSDVVESLIDHNNKLFSNSRIEFLKINAIDASELPDGDLCIIRQVLQHLSNKQILEILQKVQKFKYLIITEHIPMECHKKNLDKKHGSDIRLYHDSGVFLEAEPFSLSCKTLIEYRSDFEVYGRIKPAIMRTSLITNH